MNDDRRALAKEIGEAVSLLNSLIAKATFAGLFLQVSVGDSVGNVPSVEVRVYESLSDLTDTVYINVQEDY